MKRFQSVAGVVTASLMLGACASQPMGPRMANVMPGPNKPYEVFRQDDANCQAYANQQVRGEAQEANNRAVGSAVLGTVLGAGLGAAVGGGRGAAIGAGAGAVAGTAYGANGSQYAQGGIQRQYDQVYQQCMYSRGNQVAGYQSAPGYGPPRGGEYGPPRGEYGPPPPPPPGY